ncbi:MAG: epoxyqueuosine reductase QueH [Treponema sp.]|nr:epoxyqueuosine reductase QueH [Treponema sp.]
MSMDVLLHCCCAPCSVSCVKSLCDEKKSVSLFWYNPNIHPYTEYALRRDCIIEFSKNCNFDLEMTDEYSLQLFLKEVYIDMKKICRNCYRIRLEKTASLAAHKGFKSFSTTLLVSPYQDHEQIKNLGEEISCKYKIDFLYRDFRPLFREGKALARTQNMYMQKYCGCIFSEEERYS